MLLYEIVIEVCGREEVMEVCYSRDSVCGTSKLFLPNLVL